MSDGIDLNNFADNDTALKALQDLPSVPYILSARGFDPSKAVSLGINIGGLTSATAQKPILGTENVNICTQYFIYNRKTQELGSVHISPNFDWDTAKVDTWTLRKEGEKVLRDLCASLRKANDDSLEVRIIGTQMSGEATGAYMSNAIGILRSIPNLKIISADFGTKPHPQAVAADARNWDQGLIRGTPNLKTTERAANEPIVGNDFDPYDPSQGAIVDFSQFQKIEADIGTPEFGTIAFDGRQIISKRR